jgi:hypothetical protein
MCCKTCLLNEEAAGQERPTPHAPTWLVPAVSRVLSRAFLLLLLACDWAGDPYFGQWVLSPAYANQVMVSPSKPSENGLRREARAFDDLHGLPLIRLDEPVQQSGSGGVHAEVQFTLLSSQSVYVLMSIRR